MTIRDEIDALPKRPSYTGDSAQWERYEAAYREMAERLLHIAYDHLLSAGYERGGPTLSDIDRYLAKRGGRMSETTDAEIMREAWDIQRKTGYPRVYVEINCMAIIPPKHDTAEVDFTRHPSVIRRFNRNPEHMKAST